LAFVLFVSYFFVEPKRLVFNLIYNTFGRKKSWLLSYLCLIFLLNRRDWFLNWFTIHLGETILAFVLFVSNFFVEPKGLGFNLIYSTFGRKKSWLLSYFFVEPKRFVFKLIYNTFGRNNLGFCLIFCWTEGIWFQSYLIYIWENKVLAFVLFVS